MKAWGVIGIGLVAALGAAQDRYVSLDGGNLEPYTQWVDAATSLKAAVDLANKTPGYTVWVSNGQYDITGVITVQNTKVRGFTQVPADTVINGGGATRCFILEHAGALLDAVTVSNAYSAVNNTGPGVHVTTSGGTLTNCVIGWGRGNYPGGVVMYGRGLMTHCTIIGNTGTLNSGGLRLEANLGGTVVTVAWSLITGNQSGNGAGVNMSGGTLLDCTISANTQTNASQRAGGVYINGGTPANYFSVVGCLIEGNSSAGYAGGFYNQALTAMRVVERTVLRSNVAPIHGGAEVLTNITLRSCLIADNTSSSGTAAGGGASLAVGSRMENCTVARNLAGSGGGLRVASAAQGIYNTILCSNQVGAALSDVSLASPAYTDLFHYCCSGADILPPAQGNRIADPGWVDWAAGEYWLQPDSSCVDAGSNDPAWMATAVDLGGYPRVDSIARRVDLGAYERVHEGTILSVR